ncbi:MAG: formylglycine-generating enzyme family protein, partial [Methyloligellaceae bacterium]
MRNILELIEETAQDSTSLDLEDFSDLMKQLDSFVQEADRRDLNRIGNILSLKDLRTKLSGFEEELGILYKEAKDGLIPNEWPIKNVKHSSLIDDLFSEIEDRKKYLAQLHSFENKDRAIRTLRKLEIELDRNPLHLKNINAIRARLEELDRDIFKELLISSQLLLGTYADQLAPGSVFRDAREAPEMVVVPAGTFLMGSADGKGYYDERPQHKVTIAEPFAVGRYPVTFEEWDNYRQRHPEAHNPGDEGWGRGRRPVIRGSWDDTRGFLGWFDEFTDKSY